MQKKEESLSNTQAIYEAAQRLLTTCSLHKKLHIIMSCLEECLAWDRGWLGFVDKSRGVLKGEAYFGENVPPQHAIPEIPLNSELKNPAIIAVLAKSPVIVRDPLSDPRCQDFRDGLIALGTKCFVKTPLILSGDVIGIIGVDRIGERFDFTDGDVELLTAFADLAALAIENARLYDKARELSMTDALTGLRNYRFFSEQLKVELAQASRTRRPLSIAILDVDNLKVVNDRLGHPAGDALLQEIASIIQSSLRSSDVVARYGGDEFAIILDGIGSEFACTAAKRCLEAIRRLPPVGQQIKVTVSIGIASYPDQAFTDAELLHRADALCYKAKNAGGNRVQTAGTSDQEAGN